ncbi:hypothetical protein ACWC09_28050 [Streptomyces sp. NPDC001617]
MDEDESLHRYGLHPAGADLDEVRGLLAEQTRLETRAQGDGDTELMKLCCVQLFNAGVLEDVLPIGQAKSASMDADCFAGVRGAAHPGPAGPSGRATPADDGGYRNSVAPRPPDAG